MIAGHAGQMSENTASQKNFQALASNSQEQSYLASGSQFFEKQTTPLKAFGQVQENEM